MPYFLLLWCATLLFVACTPIKKEAPTLAVTAEFVELYIAHINDTHSAFDPSVQSFQAPLLATTGIKSTENSIYAEFGGHPRLLEQITRHKTWAATEQKNLLFLHGGDAWQGSAYFLLNEGRMNADILSQFGLDAMVLGNHEFDLNNALLSAFIRQVNFPVLAANIATHTDPDLAEQENLFPYVFYLFDEKGGKTRVTPDKFVPSQLSGAHFTVAVMGLVLDDMPNIAPNTGAVGFFDLVQTAQATVKHLQTLGVQHIVAVTHIGLERDQQLAAAVNGIDVIVGGHSHTLLGDLAHLGWGDQGQYAQQVMNPDGVGRTCLVQAGQYAQAMGWAQIRFDQQGKLVHCEGHNSLLLGDVFYTERQQQANQQLTLAQQAEVVRFIQAQPQLALVPEEPQLRRYIDQHYKPQLEAAYGQILGQVPETIQHVRLPGEKGSDQHGSQLAPLIAYAQYRWFLRPEVSAVTGRKPDFALLGAGGIRTALAQGELREGHLKLEVLPFASHLSLLSLTGAQVAALLESTIQPSLEAGAHTGKFPYGGNLRYTFVETAPAQGQLTQLEVNRGSLQVPHWQPVQMNAYYNVVMNSYSAAGNDGWHVLYEAQQTHSDRLDVVLVQGKPQVYPVQKVVRTSAGGLSTHYAAQGLAPVCSDPMIDCGVDAQAVVDFFRDEYPSLRALPEPSVTLQRLDKTIQENK